MRIHKSMGLILLTLLFLSSPYLWAQWPSDPLANLGIALKVNEQVQPKIMATPDGGCYVSWFDNDPTGAPPYGYDVFLQRLDASGVPQWGSAGIRIADRNFSSTQDYDLDVDAGGNALLAFNDDRFTPDQITVTKVNPSGIQVWGATGVQVTSDSTAKGPPKIAATTDGNIVVAWSGNNQTKVRKLNPDGGTLWDTPIVAAKPTDVSDMEASDNGSVILSWIVSTLNIRHLHANKVSSSGVILWKPEAIIYDSGNLQFGNYPELVSDGGGGAAFAWYGVDPLQCYAQHILSNGAEAFPHNGVAVSTAERYRTMPFVSFDPSTGETLVFFREEFGGEYGVYGQKLSSSGSRLWTDSGISVRAMSTNEVFDIRSLQSENDAVVHWIESTGYNQDQIYGSRVDGSGHILCEPFLISSLISGKARLDSSLDAMGISFLVWSDSRNDTNDIYGQAVSPDCSLCVFAPLEVSPPGSQESLIFFDHETLQWELAEMSCSKTFNLYQGGLDSLKIGDYGTCHEGGIPVNTAQDWDTPSPGTGFFYLVTGKNFRGEGTMGSDSDGNERIPSSPCP